MNIHNYVGLQARKRLIRSSKTLHGMGMPDIQDSFRKSWGTRNIIADVYWVLEKAKQYKNEVSMYFIDYRKLFDYANHGKLENVLRKIGIQNNFLRSYKI